MPKKTQKRCKWDKCDYVPCGMSMPHCPPQYCHTKRKNASSRNWGHCNMLFLSDKPIHKKKCGKELERFKSCKKNKTSKKNQISVDVLKLHDKMPYIWRFLRPTTRKHMITLANMPISKINIPGSIYGDKNKTFKKYRKQFRGI